ncbi:MAG TPA: hypothetical protein VFB29_12650 [Pseudolabrys sp.]|nr:hypothetical protein [Pseudolabrys sp.]
MVNATSSYINPTSIYGPLFPASSDWVADTYTAIQNSKNAGGLLGMLDNARGNNGSLRSYLNSTAKAANALALISQNTVTNAGSLYAQMASQRQKEADAKKLQEALDALAASKQMVQPKNVLDPIIFFDDGSTIDTTSNILTLHDGTQIDITTGLKVIDSASIMQLANGAYLDTKNNILTLPDGTQIDTVTGLKISVTA